MPQRIPSPRELQYHTQSIMQNALIRKKLEEQRENYRKRQEQEKQQENAKKQDSSTIPSSPNDTSMSDHIVSTTVVTTMQDEKIHQAQESPGKKIAPISQQRQHAPSPSIFTLTPTSVLRKMTAEKENDLKGGEKKKVLVGGFPQQQQQQAPFMGNLGASGNGGGNLSQMERLKMAQNDAAMFGGNSGPWDSQSMQGMKPMGSMSKLNQVLCHFN